VVKSHILNFSFKDKKNLIMHISDNVYQRKYCDINLDKKKYDTFVYAVKNHYWYQMYMDDLPIWGKYCYILED